MTLCLMFVHSLLVWATQNIFQSPSIEFNPMTAAFECHSTLPCTVVRVEPASRVLDLGDACFLRVPLQRGSSWLPRANPPTIFPPEASSCGARQLPETGGPEITLGTAASISSMLKLGSWQPNWFWAEVNERKGSVRIVQECENELKKISLLRQIYNERLMANCV